MCNSRSYYNVNDKESKDIIYFFTEEVDYEGSIVDEENKDAYFADMSEENNIQNVKNIVIGDNINAVQYNSTIISDSGSKYPNNGIEHHRPHLSKDSLRIYQIVGFVSLTYQEFDYRVQYQIFYLEHAHNI